MPKLSAVQRWIDAHDAKCAEMDALDKRRTAEIEALQSALYEARAALRPFAFFADQWDRQPLRGVDETFYSIHTGTQFAAELSIGMMRVARAALSAVSGAK